MSYEVYALDEDFIAHHGVKGQKWGVRRKVSASVGSAKRKIQAVGSPELRARAIVASKVAFTAGRVGAPAALAATGIGLPAVAAFGVSMKLVADPDVRDAIVAAGAYSKSVMTDIGGTTMKKVHEASILLNPHYTIGVNKERLQTDKIVKKMKLPEKRDPDDDFFNPKAKIDTSQVEVRN